jgi:hypothetical protein
VDNSKRDKAIIDTKTAEARINADEARNYKGLYEEMRR